jgi:hypothetical protein
MEDMQVKRGSEDLVADRLRTAMTRVKLRGTRIEYATRERGFMVWALKPGRRFRGGTDGMWRHRRVRVEAKLLMKRRGGRQIKMTSGWTITPLG